MDSPHQPESITMTAMEKISWLELLLSAAAIITALILLPFIGHAASSAFAILGLVVCGYYFLRNRHKKVIVDERDLLIEEKAKQRGVEAAWAFLLLSLIVIVLWPRNGALITKDALNWLVWIQFAIYFGIKGLVGIFLYRKQNHAS